MERALLEKKKSEAEQPEREAKERHEKAWEGTSGGLFGNFSTLYVASNFLQLWKREKTKQAARCGAQQTPPP